MLASVDSEVLHSLLTLDQVSIAGDTKQLGAGSTNIVVSTVSPLLIPSDFFLQEIKQPCVALVQVFHYIEPNQQMHLESFQL